MARPRKLGYGEGTVYYDNQAGRWKGEIRRANGERRRVSALDRDGAVAKLDEIRKEIADGNPLRTDIRLGQWITWWKENIGAAKSPAMVQHQDWALGQLADIYGKRLRDLTVDDVEVVLKKLSTRQRSARSGRARARGPLGRSSLCKVRRVLAEVLTEAERRDRVGRNVAKLARIPVGAGKARTRRSLDADEARRLLAASEVTEHHAFVTVMLYCGLRPGEATGLSWNNVDFKNRTLTIRQSRKLLPGGSMVIGDTKAHSDRVLAIPTVVSDALRRHKAHQATAKHGAPAWEDHGLVFCTAIGRPLDPSNLRRDLAELCKVAKVDRICPYELRHSAASLLVAVGMPLEEVSDLLGHKDVTMLAQVYRHRVKRIVDLTEAQSRMLQEG